METVAAEGAVSSMTNVTNAFIDGATSLATDLGSMAGGLVPVLIPVLAVVIGVGFGIKIIKKVTGR